MRRSSQPHYPEQKLSERNRISSLCNFTMPCDAICYAVEYPETGVRHKRGMSSTDDQKGWPRRPMFLRSPDDRWPVAQVTRWPMTSMTNVAQVTRWPMTCRWPRRPLSFGRAYVEPRWIPTRQVSSIVRWYKVFLSAETRFWEYWQDWFWRNLFVKISRSIWKIMIFRFCMIFPFLNIFVLLVSKKYFCTENLVLKENIDEKT